MKTSSITGYRVIIDVPSRIFGIEKDINNQRREASDIVDQVRRHVDCDARDVSIETETDDACSYCGARWTEASSTYNGGCCAEDEASNPSAEVAA
jgi:hypothetical protein